MNRTICAFIVIATFQLTSCNAEKTNELYGKSVDFYFDNELQSKLVIAVAKRDAEEASALLSRGANIDFQGTNGITALLWTIKKEDVLGAKTVLDLGADPDLINSRLDYTPIFDAISVGNIDLLRLILSYEINVNHKNSSGNTPLMHAANIIRYDIVYILIKEGARVDISNNWGEDIYKRLNKDKIDPKSEMGIWKKKAIALLNEQPPEDDTTQRHR